jgi:transposase-like protein
MPRALLRDPVYRGRRFPVQVIEQCVRWYITYKLSYRDLAAMMAERGVVVTHTTIMRWVLRYVPEYEKRWARFARPAGNSWRMDETAVSVRGGPHYLYRAVDKQGRSVDSLLCSERTTAAAQAFLRKATADPGASWPHTLNLDGYTPSHRAVRLLGEEDARWQSVKVRSSRYLNNIIEQDHRAIKRRCAPMLGLKTFGTAAVTLSGIELAHRIRKRQFSVCSGNPSLRQLWDRALAAECVPASHTSNFIPLTHQNSRTLKSQTQQVQGDEPRRYPRKNFSGGGLYMYLTPCGGKYWRYKYRYNGKEKVLSLGSYPEVPPDCAKARHLLARQLLAAGLNPADRKEQIRSLQTVNLLHFARPSSITDTGSGG